MTVIKDCKYRLPCGWCDRKNEMCQFESDTKNVTIIDKLPETILTSEYDFNKCSNKSCVEHEWICTGSDTDGWRYTCKNCQSTKREYYQTFPSVNPLWMNPNAPDINKVGDFPPYNRVTCTSGYINTNKCPEATVESILTTSTTTSAQTEAQDFIDEVKSGKLPEIGKYKSGLTETN